MAIGPRALVDLALPSGWDGAALERLRLQDGTTIAQVVQMLAAAVNGVNAEIAADPLIGALTYQTSERTVRYRDGGGTGEMDVHTEYGKPIEQRGENEGHMLPRLKRDAGLGWTWDYLNDAIMDDVEADLLLNIDRIRNTFQKAVLTRLFSNAHNTVESSGVDVGLADGSQSTVIWTPSPFDGATFLSTHTHYNERAAVSMANLNLDAKHVREHGHMPPYWLLISEADRATWTALAGYVKPTIEGIRQGSMTDIATVGDDFIGAIDSDYGALFLRPSNRIPTGYYAVVKSYGQNHPRNPLRWWYNPKFGPGVQVLSGKSYREFPVEGAMLYTEFGIGANSDRTGAAMTEVAAGGSYTVPTIA